MKRTEFFAIQGYEAVCDDGIVELQQQGNTRMWMTFFDSGVFTVREPGRGHAARLPANLAREDMRSRVAYALDTFTRRAA